MLLLYKTGKPLCLGLALTFLLLLSDKPILAQDNNAATIESLLKQLETAKPDTNKVRLLDKVVTTYRSINFEKALQYANHEMKLSDSLVWVKGQVLAYYSFGKTYVSLNSVNGQQKALDFYQKGFDLAKRNKLPTLQYRLLIEIGSMKGFLENYDQAVQDLKSAVEYFQHTRDVDTANGGTTLLWYKAAISMANIYYSQKKGRELENYYQEILNGYIQQKDTLNIHGALLLLSMYHLAYTRNFSKLLKYSLEHLKYFKQGDSSDAHANVLWRLGEAYTNIKNYVKALEAYRAAIAVNQKSLNIQFSANRGIASIYRTFGDYNNAIKFDLEQLSNAEMLHFQGYTMVQNYKYIVDDYIRLKRYDQALLYLNRALPFTTGTGVNSLLKPYLSSSLPQIYYYTQHYDEALGAVKENLDAKNVDLYDKNINILYLGLIIRDAPDEALQKFGVPSAERYQQAIKNLHLALDYFLETNTMPDYLELCYKELSSTYKTTKDYKAFYDTYPLYIAMRDSSVNRDNQNAFLSRIAEIAFERKEDSLKYQQRLTEERLQQQSLRSIQQHQALLLNQQQLSLLGKEKDLQQLSFLKTQVTLQSEQNLRKANEKQLTLSQKEQALAQSTVQLQKAALKGKQAQSRYLVAGIAALFVLSFFIGRNYINQRKSNQVISAEKQRSDDLLLNILPADVAEELKEKGTADARLFDHVTVLFTDFVNFTAISELLTPQQLVNELHFCFKTFDEIISRYNIEKIKTIGDAYLAVAGLPNEDPNHAVNTVKAALEISQFIYNRNASMGNRTFNIRIGIHSGSVVAGIVGVKKFAYDIWGDTVNTAARMEQHSLPGKINISEKTYDLVKDEFAFAYRGEIEAKNKGALKMYFVENEVAIITSN